MTTGLRRRRTEVLEDGFAPTTLFNKRALTCTQTVFIKPAEAKVNVVKTAGT
jgi:hypothetical protein